MLVTNRNTFQNQKGVGMIMNKKLGTTAFDITMRPAAAQDAKRPSQAAGMMG
jgi:hypothetical protein